MTNDVLTTPELANAVWTVLVEECGALEDHRPTFVHHATSCGLSEWRFIGSLGFGGKLLKTYFPSFHFYVSGYPEDAYASREAKIEAANRRLRELDYLSEAA